MSVTIRYLNLIPKPCHLIKSTSSGPALEKHNSVINYHITKCFLTTLMTGFLIPDLIRSQLVTDPHSLTSALFHSFLLIVFLCSLPSSTLGCRFFGQLVSESPGLCTVSVAEKVSTGTSQQLNKDVSV